MKIRSISTLAEADEIISSVTCSANRALKQIVELGSSSHALAALWSMKVSQVGCDPLNSEMPLNLIEQLNQSFTYLASAKAVHLLLELHPDLAPFTLNLGTAGGSDIESKQQGGLAAEVFSAVNTQSNRKLAKDIVKVNATTAEHKYVFFMCPGYEVGRQIKLESQPGVQIWSVGSEI